MKLLKKFLPVLAIVLSSLCPRPSEISKSNIGKGPKPSGRQVLLTYVGDLDYPVLMSEPVSIQVYIDTTIGVRYEVKIGVRSPQQSHIAVFYKFSKPDQTVVYNFTTHKSFVNKANESPGSDPRLEVVGTETVNTYSCTHLQQRAGSKEVHDFWMSTKLPGFSKLVNTLKKINPDMPALAFSGTIFNWGGLVKWTATAVEEKGTVSLDLNLKEANTTVTLPARTFDVPSK